MRPSSRAPSDMRDVILQRGAAPQAEGSCLVSFGNTRVLCTASVETGVPGWRRGQGVGWVTAEYGMLPRATGQRTRREAASGKQSGRTQEIQRLIGRSLRAVTDMAALGENQIIVDCDVLQADGGTRTASITGGYVALVEAVRWMQARDLTNGDPLKDHVAAISCGVYRGTPVLDLDYDEDSEAETDANFVMTGSGKFVEIQGTAEGEPFSREELDVLMDLAGKGIGDLVALQKKDSGYAMIEIFRLTSGDRLVIATHNSGKLSEFRELFEPFGLDLISAGELGLPEPEETGTTFVENARIKAHAAAEGSGNLALADDSGLCVDALDGQPGVYTADWAGKPRDFGRAMQRVENALQAKGAISPGARRASFNATLCLAYPDGRDVVFAGQADGTLVWPPRGDLGFGYDPVFMPDGFDITFGEMPSGDKHSWSHGKVGLSHRARAFAKLVEACCEL